MEVFGATRSRVRTDHALIAPDSHVSGPLPGWEDATGVVHISPEMGARFTQYTAELPSGARGHAAAPGNERFVFVLRGAVKVKTAKESELREGGFAYFPPDAAHEIKATEGATLAVFEKRFRPGRGQTELPPSIIAHQDDVPADPFLGDPDARLKTLLPDEPAFDMAVNVFTYQPGATLPQVEIHVMEHGLLMLAGAGVYRLGDCWYPVTAGDVIWMKAYCPQWFVAMGKQPARYVYYKDVHRDPWEAAP